MMMSQLFTIVSRGSPIALRVKLVASLENDIHSVDKSGTKWLIKLNTFKLKQQYINNHRKKCFLSISKAGANFWESSLLLLLDLRLSIDMSGVIVLNQLLGLLIRKMVHCVVPFHFSHHKPFCRFINMLFVSLFQTY